jgi:phosphatidylserine/phosphatidylglycerophosphate/cardiolipin synthase-like enzyme
MVTNFLLSANPVTQFTRSPGDAAPRRLRRRDREGRARTARAGIQFHRASYHRRGVLVTVILDKISASQKSEGADLVHDAGIPTFIDRKPKIAHNKVVVIDQATVVTGSFNFSTNAECCNAENLLVVHRPELAVAYAENFARRRAVRVEYQKVQ